MTAPRSLAAAQPFKAFYTLYAVAYVLARLPFWILKNLFTRLRQHPAYSFKQALLIQIIKGIVSHVSSMQMSVPLPLKAGAEKSQWVLLPPFESSVYTGVLDSGAVKPATIGGTWYPRKPGMSELSSQSSGDVILHIHGGAFVLGDGRKNDTGNAALTLLRNSNASFVFFPQYRLSSRPSNTPFPGALQDAVTSYLYFTRTMGIAPERIILSGDSAGGNLSMALLRYIADCGGDISGLRAPAGAWLWSPWVSPRIAQDRKKLESNPNYRTDYLHSKLGYWGSHAYHGKIAPGTPADYYINFLAPNPPLKTPTPIYMWAGKLEVLYFDCMKLAEELKNAGNSVHVDIDPIAPHDTLLIGDKIGFQKSADKGVKNAAEWFRSVRAA